MENIPHTEMFEDPKRTIRFFWSQLWKELLLLVVMTAVVIGNMMFLSSLGSMSWDNTHFIPTTPLAVQGGMGVMFTCCLFWIYKVSVHDNLVNLTQAVKVWWTKRSPQETTKYWLKV